MNDNSKQISEALHHSEIMERALQEVEKLGLQRYDITAYQNGKAIFQHKNIAYLPPSKWTLAGVDENGHSLWFFRDTFGCATCLVAKSR